MTHEEFLEQQKTAIVEALAEANKNTEGLRDYFAADALQGLIAATPTENEFSSIQAAARLAYRYADEMLKARKKAA